MVYQPIDEAEVRQQIQNLIDEMKTQRKCSEISQFKLGERLGIPADSISKLESTRGEPRISTVIKYLHGIGYKLTFAIEPIE